MFLSHDCDLADAGRLRGWPVRLVPALRLARRAGQLDAVRCPGRRLPDSGDRRSDSLPTLRPDRAGGPAGLALARRDHSALVAGFLRPMRRLARRLSSVDRTIIFSAAVVPD